MKPIRTIAITCFLFLFVGSITAQKDSIVSSKGVLALEDSTLVTIPKSVTLSDESSKESIPVAGEIEMKLAKLEKEKALFQKEVEEKSAALREREKALIEKERQYQDKVFLLEREEENLNNRISEFRMRAAEPNVVKGFSYQKKEPSANVTYQSTSGQTLRAIQFVATTGGKTYSELSYLGNVISEAVPGRNVYRYKISGNFSNSDVSRIIAALKTHGYSGAFESK